MINEIDGFYIAAQIRLTRQIHKGSFLIVEGETDERVFRRFVDADRCNIEISFGKPNALQALDLLEDEGFPGVVAVVDADFDRVLGTTYSVESLIITDQHDLDLTIIASSAFDVFVAEHAEKDHLKKEFNNDLWAIRNKVVNASLPLARCRLVSKCQNFRINFKSLRHDQFVSLDDLSINSETLIAELISRSSKNCTPIDLKAAVVREESNERDPYQLANGHDVAAILGIALRKLLAKRRDAQTWGSEIEKALRLAFDWEALMGTAFYKSLKAWEASNFRYRIFRQQLS